jgi:hypothetical protein
MKLAILLCIPAVIGTATTHAETPHSPWPARRAAPATTVPPQPPGLPYVPVPSPAPKPRHPASWEELFQRNPGLRQRLEALKKAHPEVKDWDSLLQMKGLPHKESDILLQFTEMRDLVAPAPPPVQEPFAGRVQNTAPDGPTLTVPPARPLSPLQNPLFRPPDRTLFQHEHPLLTPDTPVHLDAVKIPEPQSAGIVELPVSKARR